MVDEGIEVGLVMGMRSSGIPVSRTLVRVIQMNGPRGTGIPRAGVRPASIIGIVWGVCLFPTRHGTTLCWLRRYIAQAVPTLPTILYCYCHCRNHTPSRTHAYDTKPHNSLCGTVINNNINIKCKLGVLKCILL